jgi:hypothetical protein
MAIKHLLVLDHFGWERSIANYFKIKTSIGLQTHRHKSKMNMQHAATVRT